MKGKKNWETRSKRGGSELTKKKKNTKGKNEKVTKRYKFLYVPTLNSSFWPHLNCQLHTKLSNFVSHPPPLPPHHNHHHLRLFASFSYSYHAIIVFRSRSDWSFEKRVWKCKNKWVKKTRRSQWWGEVGEREGRKRRKRRRGRSALIFSTRYTDTLTKIEWRSGIHGVQNNKSANFSS